FPEPNKHTGHYVVMGADWGMVHDYTALSVFCSNCACELELDRFNQNEWALQRERLITLYRKWNVQYVLAEENAIGQPNIEALHNDGIPIEGFKTTMQSKGQIIRSLSLCLERNEARWRDIPVATGELEAYEAKVSKITGLISYSAPEGMHDDTVMARALALAAYQRGMAPTTPQALVFSAITVIEGDSNLPDQQMVPTDDGMALSYRGGYDRTLYAAAPGLRYAQR
ncbi:MAG TPA: hypothetical protein VIY48_15900, partial [Candidatus Paceibacterota bacterium]